MHMKRWSTSLGIRGMKIKTKTRPYYTCIRVAKIQKLTIPSVGEPVEELDVLIHGNLIGSFSKT